MNRTDVHASWWTTGTPSRRHWLRWAGTAGLLGAVPAGCERRLQEGPAAEPEPVARFPGKVALRVVNDRPPCLETPWHYYREDLTPNEAFYVRWHLQTIPTSVDLRSWRLKVGGHVERPLELSMADLRRMEAASVVAVNQCSGNSRSRFEPRVPGGQWGNGAMGNARWTGVRLADILRRAGVKGGSVQVSFDGLDQGPFSAVPDFIKALPIDHARTPEILVAYEMNGEPLPMLNGFPARLVVPGWYATYWVKALAEITVLPRPFEGFWMARSYRIPDNPHAQETPDALAAKTVPIHRMNVRSFFVQPEPDARVPLGRPLALEGIAFDDGQGIKQVQVSTDGGAGWFDARLDRDLGRFAFRRWRAEWTPSARGLQTLRVRAVNNAGDATPESPTWNHSGYMRNAIEQIPVLVV